MKIQQLPLEIIQKIFENAYKADLYSHLYICKKWYPVIECICFEQVTWSKERIEWLKKQLKHNNMHLFRTLPMTKGLQIHFDADYFGDDINSEYTSPSTRFTEKEFLFLLSLFPNLVGLDIGQSVHSMHYMKILSVYSISEQLPRLEEINMDTMEVREENDASNLIGFGAYYQFRRSLKSMDIACSDKYHVKYGKSLLELLPEFKNLTTLELVNESDPTLTLFDLLRACPNLSSLWYTSSFSVPENAMQTLSDMIQDLNKQKSSMSEYLKNLTTLKVSIPTITKPYIDFLSKYSPKSLSNVDVEFTRCDLLTWINNTDVDTMLHFCESLSKYKTTALVFGNTEQVPNRERGLQMQRSTTKITLFYEMLNALTLNRSLKDCTCIYNDRKGNAVHIRISDGENMFYQYHLDFEDYGAPPPLTADDENEGPFFDNYALPVPQSLDILGKVNRLKLLTEPGDFDRLPKRYLDHAKRYCPSLIMFEVEYYSWKCRLRAESDNPSNTSLENMTNILIQGAEYSHELFDGLIEYFPNIETLSFGIDKYLDIYREKINFNLFKFKKLKTFFIDVEGLSAVRYDPIFVQFKYVGSKQAVHYVIKEITEYDPQNSDGCGYYFEPISAACMQEGIDNDTMRRTYAIYIESLPQLAKIRLHECNSPYANLDLSQASATLFSEMSLDS